MLYYFWYKTTLFLKNAHFTYKCFSSCGLTFDPPYISGSEKWSNYKKFYTISPTYKVDQKNFGWNMNIFLGKGGPKINVVFLITNLMLNMFKLNNFFEKSVFSEKIAKNCSEGSLSELNFYPAYLQICTICT